jgi:mannose/fructose/N-acetylgalactosamine-specific phosphotransferase system component IID
MQAVSAILIAIQANIASGALIVTPMNPTVIACLLCVVFMWCESVVGYCVGCHIYGWLVKKGWMKEYK